MILFHSFINCDTKINNQFISGTNKETYNSFTVRTFQDLPANH